MRNEARFIGPCLDSILETTYPLELLEIIVVDGLSYDGSAEIVHEYSRRFRFVKILTNEQRTAPSAMNIGIRHAVGKILIRMDAHSLYSPEYIGRCVDLLLTDKAVNVGGPQIAVGTNYVSWAIAGATTSRFGVGDAMFRFSKTQQYVDTVYLGAWWTETLTRIGGFNEEWIVNQDYELNYRLREAGGKILLSPDIRCQYFVRPSMRALARQYFRYGKWKVKTLVAHPDSLRWRQLVPPAFVCAFLLSLALVPWVGVFGLGVPMLYAVASLIASVATASSLGWRYLPLLPVVFATLHFAWGLGFWLGLSTFGLPRLNLNRLKRALKAP